MAPPKRSQSLTAMRRRLDNVPRITPAERKQIVVDTVTHSMKSDRAVAVYGQIMRADPNALRYIDCMNPKAVTRAVSPPLRQSIGQSTNQSDTKTISQSDTTSANR